MSGKEFVTIFADASFSPDTLRGGWGAAILYGNRTLETRYGPLRQCRDPLDAELRAIGNALAAADQLGVLHGGPIVVMQSDCLGALGRVLGSHPDFRQVNNKKNKHRRDRRIVSLEPRERDRPVTDFIAHLVGTRGCQLFLKHVKGHLEGASGRHNMNELADKCATSGRLEAELLPSE